MSGLQSLTSPEFFDHLIKLGVAYLLAYSGAGGEKRRHSHLPAGRPGELRVDACRTKGHEGEP